MSEQRRGLGDACVLAVPAEYAGASSGSGDHPQQYFLHRPKLTTLEGKKIAIFFIEQKNIYKKIFFTVTHISEIISPDWTPQGRTLTPPRGGGPASLLCNALEGGGLRPLRCCVGPT